MDQKRIQILQERYGLTYHVPYAAQAEELIGLAGQRVLEVGGSLPKELVLEELHVEQWIGLHNMAYWDELTDEGGGTRPIATIEDCLADATPGRLGRYAVLSGGIET